MVALTSEYAILLLTCLALLVLRATPVAEASECSTHGVELTNTSGRIHLGFNPAEAPEKLCIWKIKPAVGQGLYFTFEYLHLGPREDCSDGNITLVDWTHYTARRYCGDSGELGVGEPLYIPSVNVELIYRSNLNPPDMGFILHFQAVACPALAIPHGVGVQLDGNRVTLSCSDGQTDIYYCVSAQWDPPPKKPLCPGDNDDFPILGLIAIGACALVIIIIIIVVAACLNRRWTKRQRVSHQKRYGEVSAGSHACGVLADNERNNRRVGDPKDRAACGLDVTALEDREPLLRSEDYVTLQIPGRAAACSSNGTDYACARPGSRRAVSNDYTTLHIRPPGTQQHSADTEDSGGAMGACAAPASSERRRSRYGESDGPQVQFCDRVEEEQGKSRTLESTRSSRYASPALLEDDFPYDSDDDCAMLCPCWASHVYGPPEDIYKSNPAAPVREEGSVVYTKAQRKGVDNPASSSDDAVNEDMEIQNINTAARDRSGSEPRTPGDRKVYTDPRASRDLSLSSDARTFDDPLSSHDYRLPSVGHREFSDPRSSLPREGVDLRPALATVAPVSLKRNNPSPVQRVSPLNVQDKPDNKPACMEPDIIQIKPKSVIPHSPCHRRTKTFHDFDRGPPEYDIEKVPRLSYAHNRNSAENILGPGHNDPNPPFVVDTLRGTKRKSKGKRRGSISETLAKENIYRVGGPHVPIRPQPRDPRQPRNSVPSEACQYAATGDYANLPLTTQVTSSLYNQVMRKPSKGESLYANTQETADPNNRSRTFASPCKPKKNIRPKRVPPPVPPKPEPGRPGSFIEIPPGQDPLSSTTYPETGPGRSGMKGYALTGLPPSGTAPPTHGGDLDEIVECSPDEPHCPVEDYLIPGEDPRETARVPYPPGAWSGEQRTVQAEIHSPEKTSGPPTLPPRDPLVKANPRTDQPLLVEPDIASHLGLGALSPTDIMCRSCPDITKTKIYL